MGIIWRLQNLLQRDGYDFVCEAYRELLDREPDEEGLKHHVKLLYKGVSKMDIVIGIMGSEEAHRLYHGM